jgi:alpha-beta hydrolase superfamily lysophospholipase
MKSNYQRNVIAVVFLINTLLFTNAYAIKPERQYAAKPDAFGLTYKTFKIKVNESVTLSSWACLQKNLDRPFIIISGGDAGNMGNYLSQAKVLYDEGYNVILYDYRGFGESSDFQIDQNRMYYDEFAEDLKKTIEFVNAKYKPTSIVLYGFSMGTAISRMNLDDTKTIKGLILDSFVIDPQLVVDRIAVLKKKKILVPDTASAYAQSNRIVLNKPVLIYSGLKDMVTKTEDYKAFLLKNPTSKMVTCNGNHLECFSSMGSEPNRYIVALNSFIKSL